MSNNSSVVPPVIYTYSETANILYGLFSVTLFLIGTSANSVTLSYFLQSSSYKTISKFLYLSINAVDLMLCVLMLPMGVSYLSHRDPAIFGWHTIVCNVWGVLWNICFRMSVFLIAVLSVTRTIILTMPLVRIRPRYVIGITVFYLIGQLVQASIPYWYGKKYGYYTQYVQCMWFTTQIFGRSSLAHRVSETFFVQLEVITPIFPIGICCVITIISLKRSQRSHSQQGASSNQEVKNTATMTIVILTINYVVLNLPMVIYLILGTIDRESGYRFRFFKSAVPEFLIRNMFQNLFVAMNSCMNPILYIWRVKQIRMFVRKKIGRIFTVEGPVANIVRNDNKVITTRATYCDGTDAVRLQASTSVLAE